MNVDIPRSKSSENNVLDAKQNNRLPTANQNRVQEIRRRFFEPIENDTNRLKCASPEYETIGDVHQQNTDDLNLTRLFINKPSNKNHRFQQLDLKSQPSTLISKGKPIVVSKTNPIYTEQHSPAKSLLTSLKMVEDAEIRLSECIAKHEVQRKNLTQLICERKHGNMYSSFVSSDDDLRTAPPIPPKPRQLFDYSPFNANKMESLNEFMNKHEVESSSVDSQHQNMLEGFIQDDSSSQSIRSNHNSPVEEEKKDVLNLSKLESPLLVINISSSSSEETQSLIQLSPILKKNDLCNNTYESDPNDFPQPDVISARPKSGQCSPVNENKLMVKFEAIDPFHSPFISVQSNTLDNLSPAKPCLLELPSIRRHSNSTHEQLSPSSSGKSVYSSTSLDNQSNNYLNTVSSDRRSLSSRASTVFSDPWDLPPTSEDPSTILNQTNFHENIENEISLGHEKWAVLHKYLSERPCKQAMEHESTSEFLAARNKNILTSNTAAPTATVQVKSSNVIMRPECLKNANHSKKITHSWASENMDNATSTALQSPVLSNSLSCVAPLELLQLPNYPLLHSDSQIYAELTSSTFQHTTATDPSISETSATNLPFRQYIKRMSKTYNGSSIWNAFDFQNLSPICSQKFPKHGHYIESFIKCLIAEKDSAFSKHLMIFTECTNQIRGRDPQNTMQLIRQFITGMTNYIQTERSSELRTVLQSENAELKGLEYLEVTKFLEYPIQRFILKLIHAKICNDLIEAYARPDKVKSLINFRDRILAEEALINEEFQNEEDKMRLKNRLVYPLADLLSQLMKSYQPDKKLEYFVAMFQKVDEFVKNDHLNLVLHTGETASIRAYAVAFALCGLLGSVKNAPQTMSSCSNVENPMTTSFDSNTDWIILDVQRLYIEGLISRKYLQANVCGCNRLTDLVYIMQYLEYPDQQYSPERLLQLFQKIVDEPSKLYNSSQLVNFSPNKRAAMHIKPDLNPVSKFKSHCENTLDDIGYDSFSTLSIDQPSCRKLSEYPTIFATSLTSSMYTNHTNLNEFGDNFSICVVGANKTEGRFSCYKIPLRSSLTVRELCNMMAYRLRIFNSKDYSLFLHTDEKDILLNDNVHLRWYIRQINKDTPPSSKSNQKSKHLQRSNSRCLLSRLRSNSIFNSNCLFTTTETNSSTNTYKNKELTSNNIFVYRRETEILLYASDFMVAVNKALE